MSQSVKRAALRIKDNFDRSRLSLPSHLQRLLVHNYNGNDAARFPSRVHTFAVLSFFNREYGPLADAHVYSDPETRRPTHQMEVVLPRSAAQDALAVETHHIHLDPMLSMNENMHKDPNDLFVHLKHLIGPFNEPESDSIPLKETSFSVAVRTVGAEEKMQLDPPFHDAWERVAGPVRDERRRDKDQLAKQFDAFAGFKAGE